MGFMVNFLQIQRDMNALRKMYFDEVEDSRNCKASLECEIARLKRDGKFMFWAANIGWALVGVLATLYFIK